MGMRIECQENKKTGLWTVIVHVDVDGQKEQSRLCSGSGATPQEAAWWAGHHAERMLEDVLDGIKRFGTTMPPELVPDEDGKVA